MYKIIILIALLIGGCSAKSSWAPSSTQDDYDRVIASYCLEKNRGHDAYNACINHMKNEYLSNWEVNYINEKTKWWRENNER